MQLPFSHSQGKLKYDMFHLDNEVFVKRVQQQYLEIYPNNYNPDIVNLIILDSLSTMLNKYNSGNTLYLYLIYAERLFEFKGNAVYVKFDNILEWDGFLSKVDSNIFYAAFLALNSNFYDSRTHLHESVIRHDNNRIYKILEKGISENHMHLKASGYTTEMNWHKLTVDNLFNSEKIRNFVKDKNTFTYLDKIGESEQKLVLEIQKLVIVRLILFDFAQEGKVKQEINKLIDVVLHANSETEFLSIHEEISRVKRKYKNFIEEYSDSSKKYLILERIFLKDLFCLLLNNQMPDIIVYLFNMYLLGMNKIKFEFVQDNLGMGFSKFKKNEELKESFLTDKNHKKEEKNNLEIYESVFDKYYSEGSIKKIEFRIAPKAKYQLVNLIDTLNKINKRVYLKYKEEVDPEISEIQFGIIIHYIKDPAKGNSEGDCFRNEELFIKLNSEMKKLSSFLEMKDDNQFYSYKSKIVGIDAANYELNCRPEIFSILFRKHKKEAQRIGNLHFTYHVGEEFNTLASGLRAIDEVVEFLNFQSGDRLGHALALGLNIDKIAIQKRYMIFSSLHDYIDDITWMYQLIHIYDSGNFKLLNFLKTEFETRKLELFSGVTDVKFDFFDYVDSLNLRGDYPPYYSSAKFNNVDYVSYEQIKNMCDVNLNSGNPKHKKSFLNVIARELYFEYHYNKLLKKRGEKVVNIEMCDLYLESLKRCQEIMIMKIHTRKIFIEANPTSNKKISSISRYIDLPFLKLNQFGLTPIRDDKKLSFHIPLSINTDDSSIFQTNLQNEYSIVIAALIQEGYDSEEVYRYLEYLRESSMHQSFI